MAFRKHTFLITNLLFWLNFLYLGKKVEANFQTRIINGQEVKWNGTRYQVSIRLEEVDRYFFGVGHWCGGSIISRYTILTAAHCIWNDNSKSFYPANKFSVVMGNLDRTLNDANTLKLSVKKIIVAPYFNTSTLQNDVAIMFLNQSIPQNYSRFEVIELNENVNINDGKTCLVTGWGLTEKHSYTRNLMMAKVPIVKNTTCSLAYGTKTILNGMLCAGYMNGESDACSGDSGGPLVCNNKLVGIVSFGLGCAMPGYPGVYTNVAHYYDWIQKSAGLTKKSYKLYSNNTVIVAPNNHSAISNTAAKIRCDLLIICFALIKLLNLGNQLKLIN